MTATIVSPADAALRLTPAQWRVLLGVSGTRPASLPQGYDADGAMKRWDAGWDEILDLAQHRLLTADGHDTFPEQPPTRQVRYTLLPTPTTARVVPAIEAYRAVLRSIDAPPVRSAGRPYKQLLTIPGVDIPTLVFLNKAGLIRALVEEGAREVAIEDGIGKRTRDLRVKITLQGGRYSPNRER